MPPICWGRACPEVMRSREDAFLCVGLTNTVLWLRRHPGEPCEGKEGNPQGFPSVSHNHLLHLRCQTRKGLQEGAVVWAGRGFHPYCPTLRHMLMVSLDQRCSARIRFAAVCVSSQRHRSRALISQRLISNAGYQTWSQNQKPTNPEPLSSQALLPSSICSSRGKQLKPFDHLLPRIGSGLKSSH